MNYKIHCVNYKNHSVNYVTHRVILTFFNDEDLFLAEGFCIFVWSNPTFCY